MYVSYGIIKSISVVHPSFRSSYVISCYLWGTLEPNHIITCPFTDIHVIATMHTKLHPLTSSLLLRVQACWKFGEKSVRVKFTKKISDQVKQILPTKNFHQKSNLNNAVDNKLHYTIQPTNLTGIPTRCLTVTIDIGPYSEANVTNVCWKTTALHNVPVFFLSLISRRLPGLYFDEATTAAISFLSTSSLTNHHTFLVVQSGIFKEF